MGPAGRVHVHNAGQAISTVMRKTGAMAANPARLEENAVAQGANSPRVGNRLPITLGRITISYLSRKSRQKLSRVPEPAVTAPDLF